MNLTIFTLGILIFIIGMFGCASCAYLGNIKFSVLYGVSCLIMFAAAAYPVGKGWW